MELFSTKVKVLGVASSYGWVTILLYCLWLNEHIRYFLTESMMIRAEFTKNYVLEIMCF